MDYERLPRSIAIANGKGGVGKTTTCVNLAFEAARRGAHVTVIDFDPQANGIASVGIEEHDRGASMLAACLDLGELQFYQTSHPNVRFTASGPQLRKLANLSMIEGAGDPHWLARNVAKVVRPHLRTGEWVFIDCEPALGTHLTDAALLFSEHLVGVTGFDKFEMAGIEKLLERIIELDRGDHSLINPLGILFNNVALNAKAALAENTAWFDERLGDTMPVFKTFIRKAEKATQDSREAGLTASQLAEVAETAEVPKWYQLIGTGEKAVTFAKNTPELADDYKQLADEMVSRQSPAKPPTTDDIIIDLTNEAQHV